MTAFTHAVHKSLTMHLTPYNKLSTLMRDSLKVVETLCIKTPLCPGLLSVSIPSCDVAGREHEKLDLRFNSLVYRVFPYAV